MFKLLFTKEAAKNLAALKENKTLEKRYKAACKALAYLENNPKHPSLNTHKYSSIVGQNKEEIFEAYVENKTSAAYRIFWHYGPEKDIITIIAITPHP
jgi:bisphosphoglycerate-dependent phosphoglycerate mutase